MSRIPSRRAFLGQAAFATSALLLTACDRGESDTATSAKGDDAATQKADAERVRDAARLEETAIRVYRAAAELPFVAANPDVLATAARFMGHHEEHRERLAALVTQLGAEPVSFDGIELPPLPDAIADQSRPDAERLSAVLRFARDFELSAAQTYYRLVTAELGTTAARQAIADIMPVEAQHVAVYDALLEGQTPAPTAFLAEQA